jgi:hypothetical protein
MLHYLARGNLDGTNPMTDALQDAAEALEVLAAGRMPERTTALLVAAQHLDSLCTCGHADRELLDAAAGLKTIATGGTLALDDTGRKRAAALAAHVRKLAEAENP